MVICLSATPQVNRYYFESLIPARAIENTIFFTYVNIVGTQEDLVFFGGAQISDPFGKILVKAPYFKESIIIHEIDLNSIKQARAVRPVIRDIRPQIYEDLYHISRKHTKPTKK